MNSLLDKQRYKFADLVIVEIRVDPAHNGNQRFGVDVGVGDGELSDQGVDSGVLGSAGRHRVQVSLGGGVVGVLERERVMGGDDVIGCGIRVFAGHGVDRGPAGRSQCCRVRRSAAGGDRGGQQLAEGALSRAVRFGGHSCDFTDRRLPTGNVSVPATGRQSHTACENLLGDNS